MAEIQRGKVEEVDDQHDFSDDEVATDEQHHECELEEVVEYEVASYPCGCLDVGGVGGEEMPHVSDLHEEDCEPIKRRNQSIE